MANAIQYDAVDLDTAVRTVIGEARGEGLIGWQAVAWVIRNRSEWQPPAWWGATPHIVCMKPWQFSCWLPMDPNSHLIRNIPADNPLYLEVKAAVQDVFDGNIADSTNGATMYEVTGTGAKWAIGHTPSAVIGHHTFYALKPNE